MVTAKAMIVEDEIISAMALKQSLEKQGYDVCPLVASGEEAIRSAESEEPDIVLMDINILGDMNGIDTARELFSRFSIPVVFVTGYDEKEVKKRISTVPSASYIIKPINFEKVGLVLDRILKKTKNG